MAGAQQKKKIAGGIPFSCGIGTWRFIGKPYALHILILSYLKKVEPMQAGVIHNKAGTLLSSKNLIQVLATLPFFWSVCMQFF